MADAPGISGSSPKPDGASGGAGVPWMGDRHQGTGPWTFCNRLLQKYELPHDYNCFKYDDVLCHLWEFLRAAIMNGKDFDCTRNFQSFTYEFIG